MPVSGSIIKAVKSKSSWRTHKQSHFHSHLCPGLKRLGFCRSTETRGKLIFPQITVQIFRMGKIVFGKHVDSLLALFLFHLLHLLFELWCSWGTLPYHFNFGAQASSQNILCYKITFVPYPQIQKSHTFRVVDLS